jgi:hypothetical protein
MVDVQACGASATDTGNGVLLRVVAGVATALCPDPLIELQLVRELNHSCPPELGGRAIAGPPSG